MLRLFTYNVQMAVIQILILFSALEDHVVEVPGDVLRVDAVLGCVSGRVVFHASLLSWCSLAGTRVATMQRFQYGPASQIQFVVPLPRAPFRSASIYKRWLTD